MRVSLSGWVAVLALAVALGRAAPAEVGSDQAAAIIIYPYVTVDSAQGAETLLQLSNTSDAAVSVRCVYETAEPFSSRGACVAAAKDFHFTLTPQQPIGWHASRGLATFPLDGVNRVGPGGAFNADSEIPPVETDPYEGTLRCVAVDTTFVPVERNVLIGTATLQWESASGPPDAAQYPAIGFQAHAGANNGDNTLVLGGSGAEYDGCPNFTGITHFFDGAIEPVAEASSVSTTLVLVPCTQDFAFQIPGEAQVTYEVFNEFEQRFGTGQPMQCRQVSELSAIGGAAPPERSIFNVQVAGTLTGHTRIESVTGSGLLALAIEARHSLGDSPRITHAAFHAQLIGERAAGDMLALGSVSSPPPTQPTVVTQTPTPQPPTRTPTATRTRTPSSTPSATTAAPSPTPAPEHRGGGCALVTSPRRTAWPVSMLFLGMVLLLLGRTRRRGTTRCSRRGPWRAIVVLAASLTLSSQAGAQVTTQRSASILIFPHVIADGTSDTVIQIVNQSGNTRHAHCYYVDAAPGTDGAPGWSVVDFAISLTPRQPTHWVVSRGRLVDEADVPCGPEVRSCNGAGVDPGEVPVPSPAFRGELVCVEVDAGGFPIPGNALIGKATTRRLR